MADSRIVTMAPLGDSNNIMIGIGIVNWSTFDDAGTFTSSLNDPILEHAMGGGDAHQIAVFEENEGGDVTINWTYIANSTAMAFEIAMDSLDCIPCDESNEPPPPPVDPGLLSANIGSHVAKFRNINWFAADLLTDRKMNLQSNNQLFVAERKLMGQVINRDVNNDRDLITPHKVNENIKMFGEYREIQTVTQDLGFRFHKDLKLPSNLYQDGRTPVIIATPGYADKAIHQLNTVIVNPDDHEYRVKVGSLENQTFGQDQDYFLNIIAVGSSSDDEANDTFMPVDWGDDNEKVQFSSLALNQMAENTDFVSRNAVQAILRNMDYPGHDPNPYIKYLNNEIAIYAEYQEFSPSDDLYDRHDSTVKNGDESNEMLMRFDFPDQLFKLTTQPVVICSVGSKLISEPGTEMRKLSGTLKKVTSSGFSLAVKEWAPNRNFAVQDTDFGNYIVMGEVVIDSDEKKQNG